MKFQVRRALTGDAAVLCDVGARTFGDAYAKDNSPENMELYLSENFSLEKMKKELGDSAKTFFLCFDEQGSAVGYAAIAAVTAPACIAGTKPVELHKLYVDQSVLGKGAAMLLMERCISEAESGGFDVIWLGVWERAARARAFYEKWGFRDAGTSTYRVGNEIQPDIVMSRQLFKK